MAVFKGGRKKGHLLPLRKIPAKKKRIQVARGVEAGGNGNGGFADLGFFTLGSLRQRKKKVGGDVASGLD